MEKKRLTAVKTRTSSIAKGKFIAQEGFNPSYVLSILGQRLSRVRILATVVDKFISENNKFAAVTLDDGSDTIRVKVFNALSLLDGIEKGNLVDIIGRIKEYQEEIYILPEIVTRIEDPNLEILRELEIEKNEMDLIKKKQLVFEYKSQVADMAELARVMKERFGIEQEEIEAFVMQEENPKNENKGHKEEILKLIETLDIGEGCDYQELIHAAGLSEEILDNSINELLEEGLCFEPRPGKIKKL